MARIRTIKPAFFTSLSVAALPIPTRLTFAGLWTYVDDEGRGVDDARLIKAELWPLDDAYTAKKVDTDLATLAGEGFIERYEVAGRRYLRVVNWSSHQRINRPQPSKNPPPSVNGHAPITDRSVKAHAPSTEASRPEGKGREVEGSSTDLPPPTDTPSDDRAGKVMQAAARSMALDQAASMGTQVRDHDAFVAAQTAKHLAEHRTAWQTRLAGHPDLSSRQLAEGAGRPPSDTPEAIDARARAELEQTQAHIAELHAVPVAPGVPADVREYLARRRTVPDDDGGTAA